MHRSVEIDCSKIRSGDDFHAVFKAAMGFPDFYGNNMNAWVDCMTSVDSDECMTRVHVEEGTFLVLVLNNINEMIKSCPAVYEALVDSVAFVNYRRMASDREPVLALCYFADPDR